MGTPTFTVVPVDSDDDAERMKQYRAGLAACRDVVLDGLDANDFRRGILREAYAVLIMAGHTILSKLDSRDEQAAEFARQIADQHQALEGFGYSAIVKDGMLLISPLVRE